MKYLINAWFKNKKRPLRPITNSVIYDGSTTITCLLPHKDLNQQQFELLDAYALNLKEGRVELPQIDKSQKEM